MDREITVILMQQINMALNFFFQYGCLATVKKTLHKWLFLCPLELY